MSAIKKPAGKKATTAKKKDKTPASKSHVEHEWTVTNSGDIEVRTHPMKGTHLKLKDIEFAPRPKPGEELKMVFFNPRPEDEVMDPEKSAKLTYSLQIEGQIEPPAVRVWTDPTDRKKITKVQHVAGERRLRCLNTIYDQKLPCVDYDSAKPECFEVGSVVNYKNRFGTVTKTEDGTVFIEVCDHLSDHKVELMECPYEDVLPTRPGDEIFEFVKVQIYFDISDERAMRIAFSENDNSEPLSVKAEVMLVERYLAMGYKQAQVAFMLNTNITFVSQRAAFRAQLPQEAFGKLMSGKMAAHVAVKMLSYDNSKRAAMYSEMVDLEMVESKDTIRKHELAQERHEDEADIHRSNATKADRSGDSQTAEKERKQAATSERRAGQEKARKERAEADSGTLRQGHAERAAARLGITPRKAKILPKEQIESLYVKGMTKFVAGGETDPICNEEIPGDLASIVRRTALAILNGQLDPLTIIREYKVENEEWTLPAETQAGKKESTAKQSAQKLPKNILNDDKDEEEDEEEGGGVATEEEEGPKDIEDLEGPTSAEDLEEEDLDLDDEDLDDEDEDLDDEDDEEEDDEEEEEEERPRHRRSRNRRSRNDDDFGDFGERLSFSDSQREYD